MITSSTNTTGYESAMGINSSTAHSPRRYESYKLKHCDLSQFDAIQYNAVEYIVCSIEYNTVKCKSM